LAYLEDCFAAWAALVEGKAVRQARAAALQLATLSSKQFRMFQAWHAHVILEEKTVQLARRRIRDLRQRAALVKMQGYAALSVSRRRHRTSMARTALIWHHEWTLRAAFQAFSTNTSILRSGRLRSERALQHNMAVLLRKGWHGWRADMLCTMALEASLADRYGPHGQHRLLRAVAHMWHRVASHVRWTRQKGVLARGARDTRVCSAAFKRWRRRFTGAQRALLAIAHHEESARVRLEEAFREWAAHSAERAREWGMILQGLRDHFSVGRARSIVVSWAMWSRHRGKARAAAQQVIKQQRSRNTQLNFSRWRHHFVARRWHLESESMARIFRQGMLMARWLAFAQTSARRRAASLAKFEGVVRHCLKRRLSLWHKQYIRSRYLSTLLSQRIEWQAERLSRRCLKGWQRWTQKRLEAGALALRVSIRQASWHLDHWHQALVVLQRERQDREHLDHLEQMLEQWFEGARRDRARRVVLWWRDWAEGEVRWRRDRALAGLEHAGVLEERRAIAVLTAWQRWAEARSRRREAAAKHLEHLQASRATNAVGQWHRMCLRKQSLRRGYILILEGRRSACTALAIRAWRQQTSASYLRKLQLEEIAGKLCQARVANQFRTWWRRTECEGKVKRHWDRTGRRVLEAVVAAWTARRRRKQHLRSVTYQHGSARRQFARTKALAQWHIRARTARRRHDAGAAVACARGSRQQTQAMLAWHRAHAAHRMGRAVVDRQSATFLRAAVQHWAGLARTLRAGRKKLSLQEAAASAAMVMSVFGGWAQVVAKLCRGRVVALSTWDRSGGILVASLFEEWNARTRRSIEGRGGALRLMARKDVVAQALQLRSWRHFVSKRRSCQRAAARVVAAREQRLREHSWYNWSDALVERVKRDAHAAQGIRQRKASGAIAWWAAWSSRTTRRRSLLSVAIATSARRCQKSCFGTWVSRVTDATKSRHQHWIAVRYWAARLMNSDLWRTVWRTWSLAGRRRVGARRLGLTLDHVFASVPSWVSHQDWQQRAALIPCVPRIVERYEEANGKVETPRRSPAEGTPRKRAKSPNYAKIVSGLHSDAVREPAAQPIGPKLSDSRPARFLPRSVRNPVACAQHVDPRLGSLLELVWDRQQLTVAWQRLFTRRQTDRGQHWVLWKWRSDCAFLPSDSAWFPKLRARLAGLLSAIAELQSPECVEGVFRYLCKHKHGGLNESAVDWATRLSQLCLADFVAVYVPEYLDNRERAHAEPRALEGPPAPSRARSSGRPRGGRLIDDTETVQLATQTRSQPGTPVRRGSPALQHTPRAESYYLSNTPELRQPARRPVAMPRPLAIGYSRDQPL